MFAIDLTSALGILTLLLVVVCIGELLSEPPL